MSDNSKLTGFSIEELQNLVNALQDKLQNQESQLQNQSSKLQEQESELNSQTLVLQKQKSKLQEQHYEIASLRYQLNYHLSKKYGKPSDKVPPEQLSLFDEPEPDEIDEAIDNNPQDAINIKSHTRNSNKSKPLPKDLPRERLVIDIDASQKQCSCGCELQMIGEESSEKLDITPAQVRVLEVVRPKYACKACEECVSIAPMPKTAIPKGIPTPGTLAHVILSKYQDHLPLYRQEKIFQRMGVDIPRNTLCTWVLRCAELLTPFYELMKADLLSSSYIQADETPVQVLGSNSKHYMWCYLSRPPNKPIVLYDYHPTRSGDVVRDFLGDYSRLLQTDGYAGYNKVPDVTHGACWAHVRRKYVDIIKNTNKTGIARTVVDYITKLYAIEKRAKLLSHDKRQELRQQHAPIILNELHEYLQYKLPKTPPKSPIGKAISYTLKLWDKLTIYIHHGEMEIDTNLVENSIRPFALGRKNWLFKGNDRGAKSSSIIYSILLTCKANDIEPYAYLKYILYQLPKIPQNQWHEFLPYNIDHKKFISAYSKIWY